MVNKNRAVVNRRNTTGKMTEMHLFFLYKKGTPEKRDGCLISLKLLQI